MCRWTLILTPWLSDPLTHTFMNWPRHGNEAQLQHPSLNMLAVSPYIRFFLILHQSLGFLSELLFVTRLCGFDISWTTSHVGSRRPAVKVCKMCENKSWNNFVFWRCLLKPQGFFWGRSFRVPPVLQACHTPPSCCPGFHFLQSKFRRSAALPRVRYSGPVCALFTSSLLLCGLVCFNWHVVFTRASVLFVGVTGLTLFLLWHCSSLQLNYTKSSISWNNGRREKKSNRTQYLIW